MHGNFEGPMRTIHRAFARTNGREELLSSGEIANLGG